MSRSSFGFRRSFNSGRKLSRENRKATPTSQQGQPRSDHNDLHEKRQRSRHDNCDAEKATRSIFGDVPLTDTERRYLWAAQSGNLPALEMLVEESGTFNLSCRDYLGRTALQLAVIGEHYDCIQLLLDKSRLDVIEEGLLHAIKTENVKICDMFLSHPIYSDQRSRMQLEFQHGFYEQEDSSSSFAPDITPIVLAAQCNNFDIVHMLIQKGFTIPTPHNYFCLCTECYNHKNFDRVVHSKSRLNAYRGLASTAYLSLSCDDPIYAAFELSRSLQKLADREKEHKNEYRGLSDKCKNFAVDLLDQCRTNDEVMAALHGGTDTSDLCRIKMAIRYEQKKFIAHASCQEHLASMWYAGAPWFQHQNFPIKLVMVPLGILFIPVTAIVYVFLPYSRIGKILKSPFMKFMNYICSYTAFLVLLFLGTQLSSFKSSHLFGGTEGVVNGLIMFYVLGMFWAECKQLWEEGVRGYFSQMWNYMDITMLALYTAGYSTEGVIYTKTTGYVTDNHLIHSEDDSILNPQILSKVLFSVANVMSFARIAYILPASETFGQLQISYGRMLQDVAKFIFIYITVMIAFICGLTSLYSITKNENFAGLLETTSTLFWAAFGMGNSKAPEVEEEDEINQSGKGGSSNAAGQEDVTDKELLAVIEIVGYILYGVYILGAVVVLINMLIAMMSNTFEDIQKSEDSEWKFARAKLWISFIEQGTTLPIPFNIIPTPKSILKLFRWFQACICCGTNKHTFGREENKQYEMEYKAIMHRVVLRYIHKMKFERKGESLKDEILDTREEVIFQLHSMYGRLAARLELLEKDVFALSKAGWNSRDGMTSPARSSLSYSRSVPTHPRESSNSNPFITGADQPRESYLFRRRSYYHERPKREFVDVKVRTSLEERLLKDTDKQDTRLNQGSNSNNADHQDADQNLSDGDKSSRKSSSNQNLSRFTSSSASLKKNRVVGDSNTNAESASAKEASRKESVVSTSSHAISDSDGEYSLSRRDSYRLRSNMDGSFSPRPGGDRRRDDSLRGSRKRDGYSPSPRWAQGVIKESSLEDQVSTNGERETSFSNRTDSNNRQSGSLTKRRETYNHPNIDAPFGLPSTDPRAHSSNFTEYHEAKPARRDTIQSLVLDVHQMPFSRIETGPKIMANLSPPPWESLSPTSEESKVNPPARSRSSSPQSAEAKLKAQRFNFSQQRKNSTSIKGNKDNTAQDSTNNDSDNEDQYAVKLSNVSHQQKNLVHLGNKENTNATTPTSAVQKSDSDHDKQQQTAYFEPLSLAETELLSTGSGRPGRKIGWVHHMVVPDTYIREPPETLSHDKQQQEAQGSGAGKDSIFYTNVSHETPTHHHPALNLASTEHPSSLPGVELLNKQKMMGNNVQSQAPRLKVENSSYGTPRPQVFTIDHSIHSENSTSPDGTISPSSAGYYNSSVVQGGSDTFPDKTGEANCSLGPLPEDLGGVGHFGDNTAYQRPSPLRKRESLPVISMANKHHRVLHMGREPRPRYSIPTAVIPEYQPMFTMSPSRYHLHHAVSPEADALPQDIPRIDYSAMTSPMVFPSLAANLLPFPLPVQANDTFEWKQMPQPASGSDTEQVGTSDGNEKGTPKRKSSRTKKTSIVSLVRGRRSDKVKGKQPEIKHNRSLSLNRFAGSRGDRLKQLQPQRSKEV